MRSTRVSIVPRPVGAAALASLAGGGLARLDRVGFDPYVDVERRAGDGRPLRRADKKPAEKR